MSWNYSGNPRDSKKDEYRFLLGDTDESAPIMQDEEIQYIIDTYGSNPDQAKYELFSRAATIFARDIKRSLGPQSEDPTTRLKYFNDQAASYKAKLAHAGLSVPKYAHPKVFRRGMQNNPPWPPFRRG
jgi:hypothetical protein